MADAEKGSKGSGFRFSIGLSINASPADQEEGENVARDPIGFTPPEREQLGRLASAFRAIEANLGLSELVVLLTIGAAPGISVNEVAEGLGLPQQTASRHIRSLVGRRVLSAGEWFEMTIGWSLDEPLVVQEINQSEPRRRALYATPAGRKVIERLLDVMRVSETKAIAAPTEA